jgi:cytochrome c oxidase assembly protein subunit 23
MLRADDSIYLQDRQKQASKFMDPCEAAAKASQNCMERTHYNRDEVSSQVDSIICNEAQVGVLPTDQCLDFFQVYKDCKSSWVCVIT